MMKLLTNHNRFILLSIIVLLIVIIVILYMKQLDGINAQKRQINYLLSQYKNIINTLHTNAIITEGTNNDNDNQLIDNTIIIYNRVPKTGSTSFMGIAYDLCAKNRFNVLHLNTTKNSHVMSLTDQLRFIWNITHWTSRLPALIHGHIAFIEFDKFATKSKPIYINIIRKPLERFVSYYYFLRNGDNFRPYVVRKKYGNKMSFDDCVEKEDRDCNADNMWLQIPFFCGHSVECWVPGSEWALHQAKQNLVQYYLLVGVTEQLRDFIAILEATLPQFFGGALTHYENGNKSHLRKTYNKIEPLPETIAKIQRSKIWRLENEFYEFALQQFNFIKQKTLTVINGLVHERGQQFMFEKIRPRLN